MSINHTPVSRNKNNDIATSRDNTLKHILFTGGGSAGHVTPNIALIQQFHDQGWRISYIGSHRGIERSLVENIDNIDVAYFPIATGKLRRYFSWQNFIDPFKILFGLWQAFWLCNKLKPDVIFSKGGFVSFPVVIAGWLKRIPVVLHESDLTCGLANRLSYPFANKICLTFADSAQYFQNKQNKIIVTGTPIRPSLLHGERKLGLALCGFDPNKKVMLVFGGSLGAKPINQAIRKALPSLLALGWQVVHVCGKDQYESNLNYPAYRQFAYLDQEFSHVIAAADLVVSRSGANSVYELLTLKKPHIFIPLAKHSSRGDQIENALHFANSGISQVILEDDLTAATLIEKITWTQEHRDEIIAKMTTLELPNSVALIYSVVNLL